MQNFRGYCIIKSTNYSIRKILEWGYVCNFTILLLLNKKIGG